MKISQRFKNQVQWLWHSAVPNPKASCGCKCRGPWGHLQSAAREKTVEHVEIGSSSGKVPYVFEFKTILVVPFLSEKVRKPMFWPPSASTVLTLSWSLLKLGNTLHHVTSTSVPSPKVSSCWTKRGLGQMAVALVAKRNEIKIPSIAFVLGGSRGFGSPLWKVEQWKSH